MTYAFAIKLLLVLFFLSGIIAYVGNVIGRAFGKRRLSIFGLRPKYTAMVFTIVSGIVIMALTFTTLIVISADVRTALFGMEELRGQISQTHAELEKNKKELSKISNDLALIQIEKLNLEKLRDSQRKELGKQTLQSVVFFANKTVYTTSIKGGQGKSVAEKELKEILSKLDKEVKKYKIQDVEVNKADFNSTVSYIANMSSSVLLKIISVKNVVMGGNLPVVFDVSQNNLIFHEGDEILKVKISGLLPLSEIETKLKEIIQAADLIAANRGISPSLTGAISDVPYTDILDSAKRIKGYGRVANIKAIAARDIFSIGPLQIRFTVDI
ncbi:DUF3084 domain-containing protein [Candidatus Saganbacteria bacterium]|nr:DUF3084 domain-containing protein [Candidatus Saganbacteria bacterium]